MWHQRSSVLACRGKTRHVELRPTRTVQASATRVRRILRQGRPIDAIAWTILVASVLAATVGCEGNSSGNASVTGVVTLDGKPLRRGVVTFGNVDGELGTPASGQIHDDGSYLVQVGRSGGVVSGEYFVTVSARATSIEDPNGGPPTPGPLTTPEKYSSARESGLRYHVRPGDNVIDIALSTADGDAPRDDSSAAEPQEKDAGETDTAAPQQSVPGDVKEDAEIGKDEDHRGIDEET